MCDYSGDVGIAGDMLSMNKDQLCSVKILEYTGVCPYVMTQVMMLVLLRENALTRTKYAY